MLIDEPLPFIKDFINQLDDSINGQESRQHLSITQRAWLAFCLMGILITNSQARQNLNVPVSGVTHVQHFHGCLNMPRYLGKSCLQQA